MAVGSTLLGLAFLLAQHYFGLPSCCDGSWLFTHALITELKLIVSGAVEIWVTHLMKCQYLIDDYLG
jgi:hypothetical protein